jgi:hypothetical protein
MFDYSNTEEKQVEAKGHIEDIDSEEEIVDEPELEETKSYYEYINEIIMPYPGTQLLTPENEIIHMKTRIQIQCPHKIKEVEVRTILRGIICNDCKKDKMTADLTQQYFGQTINFAAHDCKTVLDEESKEFTDLGTMGRKKVTFQNKVIDKLATQNMRLLTDYKDSHTTYRTICEYGHIESSSWDSMKMRRDICQKCSSLKRKIADSCKIFKNASEDELKKVATAHGWKYNGRTDSAGIYEWQCSVDHILYMTKRDALKGYCRECKAIKPTTP